MKTKVFLFSFLISSFLSFAFVIPEIIVDNVVSQLDMFKKKALAQGIVLDYERVKFSYFTNKISIYQLRFITASKTVDMEPMELVKIGRAEVSDWSLFEALNFSRLVLFSSTSDINTDAKQLSKFKISLFQAQVSSHILPSPLAYWAMQMGISNLNLKVVGNFEYSVSSGEFIQKEMVIEETNLVRLNVKYRLVGCKFPTQEESQNKYLNLSSFLEETFKNAFVQDFSIEVQDRSLVGKVKKLAFLLGDKLSLKKFRQFAKNIENNKVKQTTNKVDNGVRVPASQQNFYGVVYSFEDYFSNPQSLKFSIRPEKSVSISELLVLNSLLKGAFQQQGMEQNPQQLQQNIVKSLKPFLEINGKIIDL